MQFGQVGLSPFMDHVCSPHHPYSQKHSPIGSAVQFLKLHFDAMATRAGYGKRRLVWQIVLAFGAKANSDRPAVPACRYPVRARFTHVSRAFLTPKIARVFTNIAFSHRWSGMISVKGLTLDTARHHSTNRLCDFLPLIRCTTYCSMLVEMSEFELLCNSCGHRVTYNTETALDFEAKRSSKKCPACGDTTGP